MESAKGRVLLSPPDERVWEQAERLIEEHARFVITTHANPDGDGLGSETALRRHLMDRGKSVQLVNPSPFPHNLSFLDPAGQALTIPDGDATTPIPETDALIVLDASNWRRMGDLGKRFAKLDLPSLTIDHHPESREPAGRVRLIDTGAAATGELVYRLIERAGGPWGLEVAVALYVAIMTDTGSFRFSNTRTETHRIVGHLLELGVEPRGIYGDVYERRSLAQLRMLGEILAGMTVDADGQIAMLTVTGAMLARWGLTRADLEGFVDFAHLLRGSEVGMQLVETGDGKTRVSLRSRDRVNVGRIAENLGGGGHEHAAGIVLQGSLEECRRRVLAECRRMMNHDGGGDKR